MEILTYHIVHEQFLPQISDTNVIHGNMGSDKYDYLVCVCYKVVIKTKLTHYHAHCSFGIVTLRLF